MTLVFVYGTLKRNGTNHAYLASQTFIGAARTVPGFTLFSLGDFPGMVPAPEDREGVSGEIWAVDDACLQRLDRLEGIAEKLYRRGPVPLREPHHANTVETYFYLRSVHGRTPLGREWPAGGSDA